MRHILVLLAGILACIGVNAQELKRMEPEFSDFLSMLKKDGYGMFAFDISSLKEDTYTISYEIKEYSKGEIIGTKTSPAFFVNRHLMSELPESSWQQYIDEGRVYDQEKGIFSLAEKITIGFLPASDSLKMMHFSVVGAGSSTWNLTLKPLEGPSMGNKYSYDARPFVIGSIQPGIFIPLVLLGSFWYDENGGFYRFCGEKEFPADMSSPSLKYVPHYYVIGITATKND